jgi:pilus assembly protein CpaB
MRSSKGLLMLLIAGLAGLGAVVFATRWVQAQSAGDGKIAVAGADLELGSRLSPEMLRMVDWPAGSVPPGAFLDLKMLEGRVIKTSLQRGEPVLESKLAPEGTKGGLSAVVAEGKRAMTVRVNDVVGVAGFALPGNYVDIMVNTQEEGANRSDRDRAISKIVLERILVLAVAQEASRDTTKPRVVNAVTLEVTPDEAEKLDLARSVGSLSLVLRNQIDPKMAETDGATKTTLLTGATVSAPPEPAPQPVQRKVVRRSKPAAPPVSTVVAAPVEPRNCVEVIKGLTKVTECF